MDVGAWLRGLGLHEYEAAFRDNAVDVSLLPSLTAEDLKEIGVVAVGHRRRLLDAIAVLKGSAPLPADAGSGATPPPPHAAAPGPPATAGSGGGERRQLTVLFCDLSGSTALSARLDPEDLREVMAAYRRAATEAIRREGGHVARFLGDGVLAFFGWPEAHEDDAERAVRAGLAAVAAVARLESQAGALAARAGIATGPVVVGEVAARESGAVGETPNLAARLQALAKPGGVMLDAATRRLAGGLFDFADMGEAALEGFGAPVRAWRALRQRAAGNRFEALRGTASGGTAPLVGRDEELEMLLRRWRQANGGEGRVVLLSGEPGIGKSRLVAALADALAEDGAPYHRLSWYCSPQHTGSVLHPVAAWLRRAAGFARGDAPGERSAKLGALLAPDDPAPEDVALLAELLGVPAPGRDAAHEPSPQRRRERTLASLLRRVEALSRRRPVLALVEDAHWADPSTRELLDMLVARVEGLPVLLVVTHRPEFQAPWVGQAHVTAAALSRLGRRESAALVARVAGGKALPAALLDHVVGRTDGVPLFVEELTKTVLEGGLLREAADRWELAGPLPPPAVPTTLQASLLARLDRLGPAKEVAQAGAAVGREFSYELLAAVVPRPEADFRGALDRLVEAGLVFRTGEPPRSTYLFKHAMVQEAAYGTLLRARRRELHAGIARALGELSPETAEARPEVLAHHCTQAGLAGDAVDHWGKAGRRAIFRSAMAEASAHLRRALELLPALPDEPATWRRELDLQLALAVATNWTEGQAAPATGQAYARARQLCRQLGETERLAPVLAGLAAHHVNRAEPEAGRAAAEEMLRLATARGDASAELAARRLVGYALVKLGRPAPARGHLERVLAQCDAARDRAFSADFPVDTRIGALSWLANALFILGFPDQAMVRGREALAEARALRHVPSLTVALVAAGCALSGLARDAEATREHAKELEALCARLPAFRNTARLYRGWALSVAEDGGASDEGVGRMQEALDAYRAIGVGTLVPQALGLQADAHRRAGRPERGLGLLDEALAFAERSGERTFEAELHRIRGELLLELSRGDAEPCFHRAIEVARAQEAKMWELRAAVCLARLWQRLGRPAEARDLLSPICAWFTEGAACPDLVEARALLEELGGADAAAVPVRAGEAGAAAMRR